MRFTNNSLHTAFGRFGPPTTISKTGATLATKTTQSISTMEPSKKRSRRRFVLDGSEDEGQAPTSTSTGRRQRFVLNSSEDEGQAPVAPRSPKTTQTRTSRVIDLGSDSDESDDKPHQPKTTSSAAEDSSAHPSTSTATQGDRSNQGASRPVREGRKREFADLTGDDDDTPIVYTPITEDEARTLVSMEPTQKSEVNLLEDDEGEGKKKDEEDEADDDEPPSKKRNRRRR